MEYCPAIKNKYITYILQNKDESQRHYDEWKKPVSKNYLLYDSFIGHSEKDKNIGMKTDTWLLGVRDRGKE